MKSVVPWSWVFGVWCFFPSNSIAAATRANSPAPSNPSSAQQVHWSLRPIQRPRVPRLANSAWPARNPIDNFISAKLTENNLSPSPEADRRTLIRRLYFDLLGLPPSPGEVHAFEQDSAPDAYEALIEKLLASPHYGERWARHWLDVVRFAETHGFEMNQPRPNAWLYRDYVIDAFNQDKPYNQFILEQFAGDALGEDAATGFLVGGPWDQVKSPDAVLTATQRADELHDMVSTTGSAFLGLTVGCARCHDHKFDPVPQAEYYAIKACLTGVQHGERKLRTPDSSAREQEAEQAREQLSELESKLAAFEPVACTGKITSETVLRAAVNARRNVERIAPVAAKRLRFTISRTTDAEPCIDELEVYTAEPKSRNIALAAAGTKSRASSVFPNSELHRLEHLNDGKVGNSHSWISNERGRGWVELEFPERITIDRIIWGRDREQKYADRLALDYRIEIATDSDDWRLAASSDDRRSYAAGQQSPPMNVAGLGPDQASRAKEFLNEQTKLEARLKELNSVPMVYAGTFTAQPETVHRLNRGDPMQEREVVEPGGLSALTVKFCLGSSAEKAALTADQQRRLALAQWIADPANPLPARVLVNRLWLYHFGEGLVSTPSDFGRNGARPSHPELLDWLAAEFVTPTVGQAARLSAPSGRDIVELPKEIGGTPVLSGPWSLKHIHRLIVTSATYRQASAARSQCMAADAASRLLWRFPPRRLEAEALRDSILAVSGNLDRQLGGPGFSAFEPNDNYVRVYNSKKEFGPPEWRRMIYMTKVRMQQDGTFGAFDCPDGGQIAPKRMRSTTPLQALNLLNSEFLIQQAGIFAARVEREGSSSVEAQVRRAFELAFNRLPESDELSAAQTLVAEHGLSLFCRALFNANEFVFLE